MSFYKGKVAKTILFSALSMAAASGYASPFDLSASPYIGVDAEIRHVSWANGLGNDIFKHNYPQGKVYGGLKFCDIIGVEIGYEGTVPRTVKNMLPVGASYLNVPFPDTGNELTTVIPPFLVEGKFEISGPYIALVGYFPITCEDNFYLSVGAARLTANHRTYILGTNLGATNPRDTFLQFTNHKTVMRLGGGWEHLFCNCFGLRLNLSWENTSHFGQQRSYNRPDSVRSVSLKNSWNYGFGIFYKF